MDGIHEVFFQFHWLNMVTLFVSGMALDLELNSICLYIYFASKDYVQF